MSLSEKITELKGLLATGQIDQTTYDWLLKDANIAMCASSAGRQTSSRRTSGDTSVPIIKNPDKNPTDENLEDETLGLKRSASTPSLEWKETRFGRKKSDVNVPFPPLTSETLGTPTAGQIKLNVDISDSIFIDEPPTPSEGSPLDVMSNRSKTSTPRRVVNSVLFSEMVDIVQKQDFIIRLAQLLQLYGCPAHAMEVSLSKASAGIGVTSKFATFPTTMLVSFGDSGANETLFVDMRSGYHLQKLELLDFVARRCASGYYRNDIAQGAIDMDAIMTAPNPWADWVILASYTVASGGCAIVFFGAGLMDLLASSVLGFGVGVLLLKLGTLFPKLSKIVDFISGIVCAYIIRMLELHTHSVCFYPTVLSSCVWLLSGLSITMAVMELSQGMIVTGTSRMIYAFFKVFVLASGIALGSHLGFMHSPDSEQTYVAPPCVSCFPNDQLWMWELGLFPIVAVAFAILLQSAPDQITSQVVSATIGWGTYLVCAQTFPAQISVTVSAFVIATVGNVYSMYAKRPSIIPIIGGILVLLPSGTATSGMTHSVVGDTGGGLSIDVITVALSISLGVFASSILMYPKESPVMRPLTLI